MILALLSYLKKDPTEQLLGKVLILLVELQSKRISQDPGEIGTDQDLKTRAPMISTPTEKFKPSLDGEALLNDLKKKLGDLL